jgi:hypothetical protein
MAAFPTFRGRHHKRADPPPVRERRRRIQIVNPFVPLPIPAFTSHLFFAAAASAGHPYLAQLPAATGSGKWLVVVKIDANAHDVVVIPNGTDTINGVNSADNLVNQWDVGRYTDAASGAWIKW